MSECSECKKKDEKLSFVIDHYNKFVENLYHTCFEEYRDCLETAGYYLMQEPGPEADRETLIDKARMSAAGGHAVYEFGQEYIRPEKKHGDPLFLWDELNRDKTN